LERLQHLQPSSPKWSSLRGVWRARLPLSAGLALTLLHAALAGGLLGFASAPLGRTVMRQRCQKEAAPSSRNPAPSSAPSGQCIVEAPLLSCGALALASVAVLTTAATRRAGRSSRLRMARRGQTVEKPQVSQEQKLKPAATEAAAEVHDVMLEAAKTSAEVPAATAAAEPAASRKAERKPDDAGGALETVSRFARALWETFTDRAQSPGPTESEKKRGFEYRKGIEGMSLGSMHYEMLTTDSTSKEFEALQGEYERGWSVPFVNLSVRNISKTLLDVSKSVSLDSVWLNVVNLLQTLGVSGEAFDGIPVQNKWMTIVGDNIQGFGQEETGKGQRHLREMMNNMVMGKMERIAGSPMPVFLEGYGESAGVYKIVIGPRSVVVISDPVMLKHILRSSQENYTKGILSEVLEPIMGKGLIPADPATWRARRRAITPGFHKRWLEATTDLMCDCAEGLSTDIERAIASSSSSFATVNMEEKFTSVSLDIIGKAIFDYDFGSVERESPVVRAVYSVLREAERRAQSVIPYWNLPGASSVFRDQKSHEENLMLLNAVLDELIRNCMEAVDAVDTDKEMDVEEGSHVSLLQYLVMTKKEDVTTRQLRDDLMTLLIAGHETTAALLTWSLHELMKPEHKTILDDVLAEIETVAGRNRLSYANIPQMPLMKAVLLETLRLYPQPPLLIRRCEQGDEVPTGPTCRDVGDTVSLLPGQDIFISTWSLQRSAVLWGKDAAEFNPRRWEKPLPGQGAWKGYDPAKVSMYPNEVSTDFAFVPFGGGARKCVGDYFALMEAQVVLTSLLQRFEFSASESAKEKGVGMTTGATIHTIGGLNVDIKKRKEPVGMTGGLRQSSPSAPVVVPRMEKRSSLSVAQRIDPEAMVVPTAQELRMLFMEQSEASYKEQSNAEEIEDAYEKCREVTREYSKTFYLGSQLLQPDEQRVVWAIYNWCRSTDELVDGPEAEGTTMEDLEDWEVRLNKTFQQQDDLAQVTDWEDLSLADGARRFGLIQRPFQDMIGGMAMDLVKLRYETFQELEVYCYRVAGTVGLMTLPVLGFDGLQNFTEELQEKTIASAMALGLAFQLTNVLRDIGEDARRGRIYVPLEDLRRFDITEQEVLDASAEGEGSISTGPPLHKDQRWRDFMEFQMQRCERYYEDAEAGIVGLSEVNRLGVMAALFVYGAILGRIRENNYDNFSRRAYVNLTDKFLLIGKAWSRTRDLQQVAEENIRNGVIFTKRKKQAA